MMYPALVELMETDLKMFGFFSVTCDMFRCILKEKYHDADDISFESLCERFAKDHKCVWEGWDKQLGFITFKRNTTANAA